jgi:ERF superfamily
MKLNDIQQKLKAPKSQFNAFGKYHYRNAEDILEAVKPLLGDSVLTLSDEIINVGDRYYVRATAEFYEGGTNKGRRFARCSCHGLCPRR